MSPLTRSLHPAASTACSVALVALVYLLTLCALEKRGFWIIDNANKFLQTQAILESGYRDHSIPWPGQTIDPDFAFNPLPHPFSRVRDGKLYSFYPPFFATISSLPYRLLGVPGLYLLPVLSSLLLLIGLSRAARSLGAGIGTRHAAVLMAGLCTPIWFYSVVFWEHVPAACLAVWGVGFVLRFLDSSSRRDLIAGSLLATLAIYFRDELYLLCGVLVAVATGFGRGRRLPTASLALLTMAVGILPLWLFQWLSVGHPLGLHLGTQAASGIAEHVMGRPRVLFDLFLASAPSVWGSVVLAAPFLAGFLINPRLSTGAIRLVVPLYALVAVLSCLVSLSGYLVSESPILWMNRTNALFSTVPILMLAFARFRDPADSPGDPRRTKCLWIIALGYAAAYTLAAPATGSAGIHWGNRLLLVLYPILILLAAMNLVRWLKLFGARPGWAAAALVLAVATSAAAQLYSIHLLREKKDFSYRLSQEIRRHGEQIVITGLFWVPQALFADFYQKSIFYVRSRQQLDQLERKLRAAGHERFLLVTAEGEAKRGTLVGRVGDRGLDFFSVDFLAVDVE